MTWIPFNRDSAGSLPSPGWRAVRAHLVGYDCFADEIAVDFPSLGRVVDRMRAAFFGAADERDVLAADLELSPEEASRGRIVPLAVPIRTTCATCGGRGETWTEPCGGCEGTGQALQHRPVRLALPAGVSHGARLRFRVTAPDAAAVRVEVRVAIRPAA